MVRCAIKRGKHGVKGHLSSGQIARLSVIAVVAAGLTTALSMVAFATGPTEGSQVAGSAIPNGPYTTGIPFSSGQVISIQVPANSVINPHAGISIIECSDPAGLPTNDPTNSSSCDGNTIQGDTVLANSDGSIDYSNYTIYALPDSLNLGEPPTHSPVCDLSNACVLYIGEDINDFSQPHYFSQPFWVTPNSNDSGENPGDGSAPASSTPTLSTTPVPSTGPVGTTLNDQVTLSGLVNPVTSGSGEGAITVSLFPTVTGCLQTPAYTTTIPASSGNGTYTTSPGLAASIPGTWSWIAAYSGDANNRPVSDSCTSEEVTVKTAPSLSTTPSAGGKVGVVSLNDSATLSGGDLPTGSITFDLYSPSAPNCTGTPAYTDTVSVSGDGTYNTANTAPASVTGTWNWTASYSGDSNNTTASSGCGSEPVTVTTMGTPSLVTAPTAGGTVQLVILNDMATLSGGSSPTGSITFDLYSPSAPNCTGTPAYTDTVSVSGDGTYNTVNSTVAPTPGTWNWTASYSGDSNNSTASSGCGSEQVTVTNLGTPSLSTTPTAGGSVGSVTLNDSATLSGGYSPTGLMTFDLYSPSAPNCTGTPAYTDTVSISDDGTYSTANTAPAPITGIWNWTALYSGDRYNFPASSGCGSEEVSVSQDTQGITFTSNPPSHATVGGPTYNVSATATSGLPVSFSIVSAASSVCSISGSTVTFTGTGTCTIDANQPGNSDYQAATQVDQTFSVSPSGPAITSNNSATATVGTPFSFEVTTSGIPTPNLKIKGRLAKGLSFVDNHNGTGEVLGTVIPGKGGVYVRSIEATFGKGTTKTVVTQTFTLTVNQTPVITTPETKSIKIGHHFVFHVKTQAYPVPTITETGSLPTGVTFADNGDGTATLSGTPRQSGTFSFTIKAETDIGAQGTQSFSLVVAS
jgi:hypothetical protein